jgi:hypothetical protein
LNKVYVGFICNPIYRAEVDTNVTNMTVGENHKERINREIYATAQRAMDREPHGQFSLKWVQEGQAMPVAWDRVRTVS